MEYWMEFHWWYIPVVIIVLFIFFGKGGVVIDRFEAKLEAQEARFKDCDAHCTRKFFKNGKDESFQVDIQDIDLPAGDEVAVMINGALLKMLKVKKSKEIEFDIWNDAEDYPIVQPQDTVEIQYNNKPIFVGVFKETT